LPLVKGPEVIRFQLEGGGDVQRVQSADSQPGHILVSQLRANLECSLGEGNLLPQSQLTVVMKELHRTIGFAARGHVAEHV
jgi:hypothetical protein